MVKIMCKMFEVVTGKKSKGSVDKLEGLTKMYTDINEEIAIIKIPVELMEVDSRYQTDERTERDLQYLVRNWDERKLMPLMGVPHWEEGKVYIVDGYGRWIASQIVNKKKYKDLKVQMILNAPTNPEERLEFEAEMYAFQNRDVKDLTPIQKHGAMMVLHDPSTETLENMRKKYGFVLQVRETEKLLFLVRIQRHCGYVSQTTEKLLNMYLIFVQELDLIGSQTDILHILCDH